MAKTIDIPEIARIQPTVNSVWLTYSLWFAIKIKQIRISLVYSRKYGKSRDKWRYSRHMPYETVLWVKKKLLYDSYEIIYDFDIKISKLSGFSCCIT